MRVFEKFLRTAAGMVTVAIVLSSASPAMGAFGDREAHDADESEKNEELSALSVLSSGVRGEDLEDFPDVSEEFPGRTEPIFAIEGASLRGSCLEAYRNRRIQLRRRAWVTPLVALGGVPVGTLGSGALTVVISKAIMGSTAWAGLAGTVGGLLVGFSTTSGFFVGTEAILIAKLVDNSRMIRLVEDARRGDGPMLQLLEKKLGRLGTPVPREVLASRIVALDASLAPCDGTLTGHPDPRRPLRKKPVGFRSLKKMILDEVWRL